MTQYNTSNFKLFNSQLHKLKSEAESAIYKNCRPSDFASRNTTLIISNEEMNDIMKVAKSLEESGLLINCVSKAIKNEVKERKGRFLGMLLGTLGSSNSKGTIKVGEGMIRGVRIFNDTSPFD